jgi:hypothetical protein
MNKNYRSIVLCQALCIFTPEEFPSYFIREKSGLAKYSYPWSQLARGSTSVCLTSKFIRLIWLIYPYLLSANYEPSMLFNPGDMSRQQDGCCPCLQRVHNATGSDPCISENVKCNKYQDGGSVRDVLLACISEVVKSESRTFLRNIYHV